MLVYADDIVIAASDWIGTGELRIFKQTLLQQEILGSYSIFFFPQRKNIIDLIEETELLGLKQVETPMDP